jgi:hypothetical protein
MATLLQAARLDGPPMKRGKTRKNPTPVPTDNPKPRIRAGTKRALAKVRAFEPTPQPSMARSPRSNAKVNAASLSPVPQPVIKKNPALSKPTTATTAKPPNIEAPAVAQKHVAGPVRHVRQARPAPIPIPAILLEPDHVPLDQPAISGPGARFVMSPAPVAPVIVSMPDLPESYGTQEIFLAARDPYWVFASWDLDEKQRRRYNEKSTTGALTIRLRIGDENGPIHLEIHTQPNSKDWFIHAGRPETTFVAELGYHEKSSGTWQRISISKPVTTPVDRVAPTPVVERALAPLQTLQTPVAPFVHAVPEPAPRREEPVVFFAIPEKAPEPRWNPPPPRSENQWREDRPQLHELPRRTASPQLKPTEAPRWTPRQAQALEELISMEFKRTQAGSLEIEQLLRRRLTQPISETPSSLELLDLGPEEALRAMLGLAKEGAPSSLEMTSAPEAPRGFWFKVNAELIIYGSTEPDARVSIGGRPIRLRPDGTFSYRFALPDGAYQLPIVAVSRDGLEALGADLRFSRATEFIGNVGAHPQDAGLKTPSPANL